MDQQLQTTLTLLDDAIEASETVLAAWAEAVRDRAALGALAALNYFGHRYLLAIRHQQYLRVNCWISFRLRHFPCSLQRKGTYCFL
jgi:hypothetical protein